MTPPAVSAPPATHPAELLPPEPMDPQLRCIQPGGGVVFRLEQAWGYWRRFWLRTVRPGYVRRMAATRKGESNACPHPVLDPRDVKFYRNQPGYYWDPADDPFRWRDRLPLARPGLAEVVVFTLATLGPAAGLAAVLAGLDPGPLRTAGWVVVAALVVAALFVLWFFRDPPRAVPPAPGLVVAPADGKVVDVAEVGRDEFVGGPAVRVGIFLSVFDVHVNRAPAAARVVGLTYRPGRFLNALRPSSARENEQLAVRFQETGYPYRRYVVRQIAGAIARRIVCWVKPGDELARGERYGMIKFGSRTEIVLPREDGLRVRVAVGDTVRGGVTVLAEFAPPAGEAPGGTVT